MPCHGGAAVVIGARDVVRRSAHRPVFVTGFGERITGKTPTYSSDLLDTPMRDAAEQAFTMAGTAAATSTPCRSTTAIRSPWS